MPKTIVDFFKQKVDLDRFVFEIETEKKSTFKEIFVKANKRKSDFIQRDQRVVSVILPNSILYIEYLLALLSTNNIFNPIPYFVSINELEKIFEYIDPSSIVTDRDDIIELYKDRFKIIKPLPEPAGIEILEEKDIDENKPAALYYSSGTTGDPKGVLYSHKNMVELISSVIRGFKFTENDNHLAFLPFGHTASVNYNILPSLMAGSNLYISEGFDHLRNNFFEVLAEFKISFTEIVPTVLLLLVKLHIDISKFDLSKLKFIGCGSSTLPLTSQKKFMELYNIKVCNLYGLSETGPSHIDHPLEEGWRPGSIGIPLDVNQCKIADDGEILLKGENVFIGYHKNEELYEKVVLDGWFSTGDIGIESEGKFFFVERKKDLIIKGGINIVPKEIEEIIYKSDKVHECVVVGKENKLVGEEIVAVVVPKNRLDDEQTFIRTIKNLCKENLSNYKVPSKIFVWDQLPKTHSNKLLRRKVREDVNKTVELEYLLKAVLKAGKSAMKSFKSKKYQFLTDFQTENIREKTKKELVTKEDIACQEIIMAGIKKHDPEAVIYSEELANLEDLENDRSALKYLIDPLDGTHNYCFGLPYWGISVALLNSENQPIGAVINIPEFSILLKCDGPGHQTLIYNHGAWVNTTTAKKQIHESLICYDNQFYKLGKRAFEIYQRLTEACFTTRIIGSAVFDIALIACGKINGRIWNKTNSYDIAGGLLIVKGAGGSVSNFTGKEASIFTKDIIMCSDKVLNKKIVNLIGEC